MRRLAILLFLPLVACGDTGDGRCVSPPDGSVCEGGCPEPPQYSYEVDVALFANVDGDGSTLAAREAGYVCDGLTADGYPWGTHFWMRTSGCGLVTFERGGGWWHRRYVYDATTGALVGGYKHLDTPERLVADTCPAWQFTGGIEPRPACETEEVSYCRRL